MDVKSALQEVLKTALNHDGFARSIREAAKALDKCQAHLCVLASNYDEPMYVKLVEALCAEHQINLIKVDDSKKFGERIPNFVTKSASDDEGVRIIAAAQNSNSLPEFQGSYLVWHQSEKEVQRKATKREEKKMTPAAYSSSLCQWL
ncbi:40S ribosomal protein S12 [Microtus ochrogaster]|uniref:40S ribosomal protein S12 n=1 Tax=Microtus ochrogaster TaxID=79684 RepID=A0A8J6H1W9_MICOH|nr:40S ribosomal protein S12 [Microtus ochrogaster]